MSLADRDKSVDLFAKTADEAHATAETKFFWVGSIVWSKILTVWSKLFPVLM